MPGAVGTARGTTTTFGWATWMCRLSPYGHLAARWMMAATVSTSRLAGATLGTARTGPKGSAAATISGSCAVRLPNRSEARASRRSPPRTSVRCVGCAAKANRCESWPRGMGCRCAPCRKPAAATPGQTSIKRSTVAIPSPRAACRQHFSRQPPQSCRRAAPCLPLRDTPPATFAWTPCQPPPSSIAHCAHSD